MGSGNGKRTPWLDKEPGRPSWYIYWYDPKLDRVRRRSTRTTDDSLAQRLLGQFIIDRAEAEEDCEETEPNTVSRDPALHPIAEALNRWLTEEASHQTQREQAVIGVGHLVDFFESRPVSAVTPGLCRRYAEWRGKAANTVRRELSYLARALNYAVEERRLTMAPKVSKPPPGPSRTRFLTPTEIGALVQECSSRVHLWTFVVLMMTTGSRPGAILEMERDQVLWERDRLLMRPNGRAETTKGRPWEVPLAPIARLAIVTAIERENKRADRRREAPCQHIVTWRGARVRDIGKAFGEAVTRAGLDAREVTPHVPRHTAASYLLQIGEPIWHVAQLMGHTVQRTTELYGHLSPTHLKSQVAALDRLVSQNSLTSV